MIVVQITGGLGNQMFQYGIYRLLEERYQDTKVRADLTWFHMYREHNGYELKRIFGRPDNPLFRIRPAGALSLLRVTGIIPPFVGGRFGPVFDQLRYYPNRLIRLFNEKRRQQRFVSQEAEKKTAVYQRLMNLDTGKDWYLCGYWTDEIYYQGILDQLRKEFIFDKFTPGGENEGWAKRICSGASASIHVRRGDYLTKYAGAFCVLGQEYYQKAVRRLEELTGESLEYYIFSDDGEFADREFDWLPRKYVVTGNRGKDSYKDMQLMSMCRHHILANSTFSLWAALLNGKQGRQVIYPRQYMPDQDNEIKHQPGWHRLDINQ